MSAREIAVALGGNGRREGHNYRAPCPLHLGNSLTLADGRDGKLLLHCFGGCEGRQIFAELWTRGLISGEHVDPGPEREDEFHRFRQAKEQAERLRRGIVAARALYRRGRDAAGTP